MNREKKSVPFLQIGSSSLLLVFLVLCLVIFAVLTLAGAQSDYRFSQRIADRRTAYYAACNQAEEEIARLSANGELAELSQDYSFTVPIDEGQALSVVLSPDGKGGCAVTSWETVQTEAWTSDSGSRGITSSLEKE